MTNTMSEVSMVIDPVCGMRIDPKKAVGSSQRDGEAVYFCSRGCEISFDAAPERYTGDGAVKSSCCSPGHSCH